MAGRAYGNVMKAGRANIATSGMTHKGMGRKNTASGATRRPNPTGGIKSATRPIKGMDRGAG